MKSNEIFKTMLDWIYANTDVNNQVEVSRVTGINEVSISRVLNGKIKKVKQETLRKINVSFGNIFNPAWIRGDSEIMLFADCQKQANDCPAPQASAIPNEERVPDINSLINVVLKAKDETIMSLKRELSAKDETIEVLRAQQTDKERYILSLQQQLRDVRTFSDPQKDYTNGYSYPAGVAEPKHKQPTL